MGVDCLTLSVFNVGMENTPSTAHAEHPLDVAARHVGSRMRLAAGLDVTPAAIGNWKMRGVPIDKCMPIERLCQGAVTRRDLRDDWAVHWPELAVDTAATQREAA